MADRPDRGRGRNLDGGQHGGRRADPMRVGGAVGPADNMAAVARTGVTHIIDMQIEFDDTNLAEPHGIEVLWNPIDDDFKPKPPELLKRGADFATAALDEG